MVTGADGCWNIYRVPDTMQDLEFLFGKPDKTATAPKESDFVGFKGGIVVNGSGWGNGSRHVTIWNGSSCAEACHLMRAQTMDCSHLMSPRFGISKMKFLRSLLLRCVVTLLGVASTQSIWATNSRIYPITSYSQQNLLKNWALSVCIANIVNDKKAIQDASATANAYLEFGKQDLEVYDELRNIVKKFVGLKYSAKPDIGQAAPELNTMKCIDLFHSNELDRLTRRLEKRL